MTPAPASAGTRGWRALDWYETPRYYDLIFDAGTAEEADFLEAVAARHGGTRGRRVLEPACGSGRLVLELARRGWRADGFDRSQAMLAHARRRLARARVRGPMLFEADLENFRAPSRYDLAHCLVCTFQYLLSERAARAHLAAVARALVPGGVYVLGFHLADYAHAGCRHERWVARRGDLEVVCNIRSWPPVGRRERVRSRLRVREGGVESRFETHWWFRSYDAAQVRRLLRAVPAFEHVATYDFTYDPKRPRELDDTQLDTVLVLRRR